ncbi:saccharopine dehydrogenase NADP-binding domain-containing protein [Candidatus Poribacteria bacterium]|nr:saccharopine dehydrogenase NADP-binding domain-containing protein [Candidatus Poribacteria bacterium]
MPKVIVLGGCGAVGSVAVKTLAAQGTFSKVVIGDMNMAKAKALIAETGSKSVTAVKVNAEDPKSVKNAIKGCDIVLNCVGPFYKSVKTVLGAVIESGINYVDICDDVDVTVDILKMDKAARKAGVMAVIGMGASPGVTNLFAKFVADTLLDETDSVDIFHTHGGEPIEGPGVIGHRFHCMTIDIPMFLDGELKYVKYFREDGIALRQTFEFPIVGNVPLYPYPHPEQVTLPNYIKVRQVTNKGSVLPIEYYELTGSVCKLGLASKEPLEVAGKAVVPYDFAVAYIIRERDRILKRTKFGIQRGAMSVVVKGKKDGERQEYRVHMASEGAALGEGTGEPAAMGVVLMQEGKVTAKGVLPPEGCIDAKDFLGLQGRMKPVKTKGKKKIVRVLYAERIDSQGNVTKIDL